MRAVWALIGFVAVLDAPSSRVEHVTQWAEAVIGHRPGASDPALERVAEMSIADVQTLVIDAQTLTTLMRRPGALVFYMAGPGKKQITIRYSPAELESLRHLATRALQARKFNEFLKRAALLESDVAMLNIVESVSLTRAPVGAAFRFRIQVSDGQTVSINQAPVHWELARTLLNLVSPDPAHDETVRAWYIATAAITEWREEHDTDHLNRAAALFPTDATILFFNGCLHEGYASDRLQAALKAVKLPAGLTTDTGSAHNELLLAQGFLKKAVAADPNAAEARLHFGRVLGLLGRHQEAAAELSQALDAIDDPANEYYASLFLGREEEALGRYDAARRAYERAASLYPGAQSPHLALSQLAWHGADRGGALKALREALAATDDDPWWTYAVVHARQADALLEELRRPFLEDRQ